MGKQRAQYGLQPTAPAPALRLQLTYGKGAAIDQSRKPHRFPVQWVLLGVQVEQQPLGERMVAETQAVSLCLG